MILLVSTVGRSSEDCASVPEFKLQVWASFRCKFHVDCVSFTSLFAKVN